MSSIWFINISNYHWEAHKNKSISSGPDGTAASGHVKPPPFPSEVERPGSQVIIPSEIEETPANGPSEESYGPGPTYVQEPGSEDLGYIDEDASSYPGPIKPTQGPGDT